MSSQDQTTMGQGGGTDDSLTAKSILRTLEAIPDLSYFLNAIRTVGLERELIQPGYRTLFAPTNEALDAMPNDFYRELLKPENANRLRGILSLHIVQGRQTLADLNTTPTVRSLGGEPVEVSVEADEARFGGARILRADIPCTNGQLHIIDRLVVRDYSYSS
jgi:uncharacterized surface protein with fasciclin (FAS1) repeats